MQSNDTHHVVPLFMVETAVWALFTWTADGDFSFCWDNDAVSILRELHAPFSEFNGSFRMKFACCLYSIGIRIDNIIMNSHRVHWLITTVHGCRATEAQKRGAWVDIWHVSMKAWDRLSTQLHCLARSREKGIRRATDMPHQPDE